MENPNELALQPVGSDEIDTKTVLMLFVAMVIVVVYLISLLLIVIRRAKRLIVLYNRLYYLTIVFYVATKLVICAVLTVEIIVGEVNYW